MGASNPEQRYALARLVFEAVEVTDDRVATVMPQPDFAPFFVTRVAIEGMLEENENGADEAAPPTEVLHQRKRRGSRQHFQNLVRSGASVRVPVPGPLLGATPASGPDGPSRSRPDAPACCRYRARPRKLTAAQVLDIRALAATRSLRSLAAEFGVSHETIRSALR